GAPRVKQVWMGRDFGFSDSEVERCAPSWATGCPKLQSSPKWVETEVFRVTQLRFRVGARTLDRKSPATVTEGPEAMPKGIWASETKGACLGGYHSRYSNWGVQSVSYKL